MIDLVKKPTLGQRIRHFRNLRGYGQDVLSDISGVSQRQISAYELDKNSPRPDTLNKIANALGVSAGDIVEGSPEIDALIVGSSHNQENDVSMVPILSEEELMSSLGKLPYEVIRGQGESFPVPSTLCKNPFAFRLRGSSMEPQYSDGTILILDPERFPRSGDDVLFEQLGHVRFKRYINDHPRKLLMSLDPRFPAEYAEDIQLLGVCIMSINFPNRGMKLL